MCTTRNINDVYGVFIDYSILAVTPPSFISNTCIYLGFVMCVSVHLWDQAVHKCVNMLVCSVVHFLYYKLHTDLK